MTPCHDAPGIHYNKEGKDFQRSVLNPCQYQIEKSRMRITTTPMSHMGQVQALLYFPSVCTIHRLAIQGFMLMR